MLDALDEFFRDMNSVSFEVCDCTRKFFLPRLLEFLPICESTKEFESDGGNEDGAERVDDIDGVIAVIA